MSEPNATGTIPAATAAADPPDEPPGTRRTSHGFLTGPKAEFSFEEPMANSSQFVFPMITAPACQQSFNNSGVIGWMIVTQDARAAGCLHSANAEIVFDGYRNAGRGRPLDQ